jgi:hypothetical protein
MKKRTVEEQREYMRGWRAEKKRKQQESQGLAEPVLQPRSEAGKTQDKTPVDMSTPVAADVARETSRPTGPSYFPVKPKPSYLAAPDDECLICHHDRQNTHPNGGACGHGCLCRRFHAAGEVVVPCGDCSHTLDTGHAATPCNAWIGKRYCGCPAWVLDPTPPLDESDPF